jgi:hypothetical protein
MVIDDEPADRKLREEVLRFDDEIRFAYWL